MQVVHCKRKPYTVYIGRGSVCGNPFTHLPLDKTKAVVQVASVEDSIRSFEEWLNGEPCWWHIEPERRKKLIEFIPTLKETDVLGCFCSPNKCHGDVIIKFWQQSKA